MIVTRLTLEQWLNLAVIAEDELEELQSSTTQFDEFVIDGKRYLLEIRSANNAFSNFKYLYPDMQGTAIKGLIDHVLTKPGVSVEIPGIQGKPSEMVVTRVEREGYDYALLLSD